MQPSSIALQSLLDTLAARHTSCELVDGSFVRLGALPLDIYVHDVVAHQEPGKPEALSVVFDARSRGAQTPGVCVLSLGYGDGQSLAAHDAADQWLSGVFPVVQSWLTQATHVCSVTKAQMIVSVRETSERFGWSVHLGPILTRVYGASGLSYTPPDVRADVVFGSVFDTLHPMAPHTTLFWLECFAVRYPDGTLDATARFHNEDWPDGREALLVWASQWPSTEGCILSRRQFLLFEPVPAHLLPSSQSMTDALEQRTPSSRPWWRRLFQGA